MAFGREQRIVAACDGCLRWWSGGLNVIYKEMNCAPFCVVVVVIRSTLFVSARLLCACI